uniref:Homeobox domain-containing protein n=1 Tax=Panagrellus redivivus TaxID=6233 RepID=A0A7E4VKF2_PANRE
MNVSTTPTAAPNDTRRRYLPSTYPERDFLDGPTHQVTATDTSSPGLTLPLPPATRCDSVGDSLGSASSTTSTLSDIDQSAYRGSSIPFHLYGLPYGSQTTPSVVNPFLGLTNAFPSGYRSTPTGYPQQIQSNDTSPFNQSPATDSNATARTSAETPIATSSSGFNGNVSNTPGDLLATAAAAAAVAASTSAGSSASSTSSRSSGAEPSVTTTLPSTEGSSSNQGGSGTSTTTGAAAGADDHLQRLAQMTHGVGLAKSEADNPDATVANLAVAAATADAYQTAAAAAYAQAQAYGSWQNYYQFNNQMAPATAAFPGWPGQCYPASHWAQTKKGRQTYQRYQTSVLESKFQQSSYVSKKQREELRLQTNLTDRQIKIWFQNRRMKAKKEKNRCDEQNEHQPLMPPNPPKNMMPGSNGNSLQHPGSHLGGLMDDSLGLGIDQDKLKANNASSSMLGGPPMWCPPNMNGSAGMHSMVSMADTMANWSMLPPGAAQLHSQGSVTGNSSHPHYPMGYPLCNPNI